MWPPTQTEKPNQLRDWPLRPDMLLPRVDGNRATRDARQQGQTLIVSRTLGYMSLPLNEHRVSSGKGPEAMRIFCRLHGRFSQQPPHF